MAWDVLSAGGLSGAYVQTQQDYFLTLMTQNRQSDVIFHHDDIGIHIPRVTKSWSLFHCMEVIVWPVCSLEFNLIENL